MSVPFFLTVDTEGDNIWGRPKDITSVNTGKLYRFQELCEKHNIKPIYLTNYEAAINEEYQKFVAKHKNNLEVGLHLHAWNSPPVYNLTGDDFKYQPYLHEYPIEEIRKKITFMVKLLKETFQTDIVSHRGGRYSINDDIFQILLDNGVKIDCSVVPGIDWSVSKGSPDGEGGPNFIGYEENIYNIYNDMIEIPVSTYRINKYFAVLKPSNIFVRAAGKIFNYRNLTLRSKVNNLSDLKKIVKWNLSKKCTHLEYIIHSSELVDGYSGTISSKKEEDIFYKNLEAFFMFLSHQNIVSMTFKEYLEELE